MNSEHPETVKTLAPTNGLVVIDPATSRALPVEGALVRGNAEYWIRRLRDGDVTELKSAPSTAATVTKPGKGQESKT